MSEFDLIQKIKNSLGDTTPNLVTGIGDDAAVITTPTGQLLFCSDVMVEGVHFDLNYMSAADVGFKAVASCLSDIAGMNGRPLSVVISIAVPHDRAESFISGFYEGVRDLQTILRTQKTFDTTGVNFDVAGGDLSRSPTNIFVDVAAIGETVSPLLRSGAKPGDILVVSGQPGLSAKGLQLLQQHPTLARQDTTDEAATIKHRRPVPRFDLLAALHLATPTALIDLSDGVASESLHLAKASQVSIIINSSNLVLDGGEDYELLATVQGPVPTGFKAIGFVEAGPPGLWFEESNGQRSPLSAQGFDHFR